MIFNSLQFLWLFPLIFAAYYLVAWLTRRRSHGRAANLLLAAVSYAVYAQWGLGYALVMLAVTAVTYAAALLTGRARSGRRWLLAAGVVVALLPLAALKYSGPLLAAAGGPAVSVVAPLGISFFTFQALGYLFDVYRRRVEPERDWWDYMLFVSFFPQILCGPISRAGHLLPQIKSRRRFDYSAAVEGLKWLLWGMFLKVVMADRLAIYVNLALDNYQSVSGSSILLASVFFSFQIYGDFAGYSLMARGTARLLGFDLVNNFNNPYLATSVTDFWRRWHISLSTWLRDYVYIPLGGSRCGRWRNYLNILTTFIVCGLWHGAQLSYLAWGALHGVLQIGEKALGLRRGSPTGKAATIARAVATFVVINFTMLLFRMPTVADWWSCSARIFTNFGQVLTENCKTHLIYCVAAVAVALAHDIFTEARPGRRVLLDSRHKATRWATYAALTLAVMLFGVFGEGQFIYMNF